MNTSEKAKMLIKKFANHSMGDSIESNLNSAKNCALIAVEEITSALNITTGHCELRRIDQQEVENDLAYWEQVEIEIRRYKA